MKRIFIVLLFIVTALSAKLQYNAAGDYCYSTPQTADINISEYNVLLLQCAVIVQRINTVLIAGGKKGDIKVYCKQVYEYLKQVGTPTALRLLKDIKEKPSLESVLNI